MGMSGILFLSYSNTSLYTHYDNQNEGSSNNLKTELLYDLSIPFLATYPKDSKLT